MLFDKSFELSGGGASSGGSSGPSGSEEGIE